MITRRKLMALIPSVVLAIPALKSKGNTLLGEEKPIIQLPVICERCGKHGHFDIYGISPMDTPIDYYPEYHLCDKCLKDEDSRKPKFKSVREMWKE